MLQRTASSAYTWWWASQIRTKQSKWLDNDLQEMEERVKFMIKLIDEDADSFAKKAEMYFRRRPELISSVEAAYRAYKALADRYDRISGELHKANHTIATAFPDQVPMMEDNDDDGPLKTISSMDPTKLPNPPPDLAKLPKPPPELPRLSSRIRRASTQIVAPKRPRHKRTRSHITLEQAQEEIDKLQKRILVLQTEKEFFKSSYECGLTKYWDIERQMIEMQEEVSELQDEFNAGSVIEDDEARALMAATAIKSCEDTLVSLHEKQKRSSEEASIEHERIKVATVKLRTLRGEEPGVINDKYETVSNSSVEEEVENLRPKRLELQSICDKVKDLIQMSSESSVAELADKIDSLVEKVISLEIIVSSQTAQILRLKAETDELHKHLRDVEEDKKNTNVDPSSLNKRLIQVEEQLQKILDLERSVQNEKGVVRSHFAQTCTSLNDLSEKLQSPTKKDQLNSEGEEKFSNVNMELLKESNEVESADKKIQKIKENSVAMIQNEVVSGKIQEDPEKGNIDQNSEAKSKLDEDEDGPDWQQLLAASGLQGKDKILLYEYTSILRSYKVTRKRLTDMEKRNQECHSETMQQIQERRCANAIKDEEIKTLRRKLFSAESLRTSTKPTTSDESEAVGANTLGPVESEVAEDEVKICNIIDQMFTTSPLEEKLRGDIDSLLEENLDFWLRFSTSYHQIQKFSSSFRELQAEAEKVIESKNADHHNDSSSTEQTKSDTSPTDKKSRELNTELQVWLEHNELLQGELRCRFASLCNIQEEITSVTKSSEGEDAKFTPYQAAKFQGEVINMQQENNKVAKELQAGLDHVKGLQAEVGRALSKLHENFELSRSKASDHYNQFRHLSTRSRVPLKAFLFAARPKKTSIFACMNPVYHHHHKQPDVKSAKLSKDPH